MLSLSQSLGTWAGSFLCRITMVCHLCLIPLPRVNERILIRPPLRWRAWMNQLSRRHPGRRQPTGGRLENPSSRQSNNLPLSLHPSRRLSCDQRHPSSRQSNNLPLSLHSSRLPRHQENPSRQQWKNLPRSFNLSRRLWCNQRHHRNGHSKNLPLSFHLSRRLSCHQRHPSNRQSKNLPPSLHSSRLPRHQENPSSQQSKSLRPRLSCRVPPAPGNSAPSGPLSASKRQRSLYPCFRNTGPRPPARWQEGCITCQWRLA